MSKDDPIQKSGETVYDLDPTAELTEEDFGFIITTDGKLKGVYFPNEDVDIPESVQKILDIFNIGDVDALFNVTIH
jgi:hypothetical protein